MTTRLSAARGCSGHRRTSTGGGGRSAAQSTASCRYTPQINQSTIVVRTELTRAPFLFPFSASSALSLSVARERLQARETRRKRQKTCRRPKNSILNCPHVHFWCKNFAIQLLLSNSSVATYTSLQNSSYDILFCRSSPKGFH